MTEEFILLRLRSEDSHAQVRCSISVFLITYFTSQLMSVLVVRFASRHCSD